MATGPLADLAGYASILPIGGIAATLGLLLVLPDRQISKAVEIRLGG